MSNVISDDKLDELMKNVERWKSEWCTVWRQDWDAWLSGLRELKSRRRAEDCAKPEDLNEWAAEKVMGWVRFRFSNGTFWFAGWNEDASANRIMSVDDWNPCQDMEQATQVLQAAAKKLNVCFGITVYPDGSIGIEANRPNRACKGDFKGETFGERALNAAKWATEC